MVEIGQEEYKIYGTCVSFKAKDIKLLVTTKLGPRIIFYGKDGKNIMFEDLKDTTNKGGEFFDKNLSGKGIWHLYGGHRLWKSPEYMDTYYPDNAEVEVERLEGNKVAFISPIELTTHLQKTVIVEMSDEGNVTLTQIIKNMGDEDCNISAWGLTVLDNGAKATIKLSTEDTGFLPNRNIVFWPYTNFKDGRINYFNDRIEIEQQDIIDPIKIGVYTKEEIKARIKGMDFSVKVDDKEGIYPDYSCNVECYTNNYIFEIETLSPLQLITPKQSLIHKEYWTLK